MPLLELPHSADCLVCGRQNPRGLKLSLSVDPTDGVVSISFISDTTVCGFADTVHGGVLATVFDEAMVWAASWAGRPFCLCGELNTRFLLPAKANQKFVVSARVIATRSRMITATGAIDDMTGKNCRRVREVRPAAARGQRADDGFDAA